MEYKIINSDAPISKVKVEYTCPHCNVKLKNPISEAGETDTCPDCGNSFTVPGTKDLEYLQQKFLEETMKKASKDKIMFEASQSQPKMASIIPTNKTYSSINNVNGLSASEKINTWLARAVAALNAVLFIALCCLGLFRGIRMLKDAEGYPETLSAIVVLVLTPIGGICVCGSLALLCIIQSDLRSIRETQ